MSKPKTAGRLICEKECAKNKGVKDFTLATEIYKAHKDLFRSQEQVRGYIKTIRGHSGKGKRSQATQIKPITYDNSHSAKPIKKIESGAKILLLDIETAPLKGYIWGLWKQNIGINQITNDWFILTWAAKWLFEEKVYSMRLTSKEAIQQKDKRIMEGLWEMLNEADVVIGHNSSQFDIPKINTRFLINGMIPPLPYQQIDTLKVVKKSFAFSSNKQEFLNMSLGSPRKVDTGGFDLWDACYKGDEQALKKMEEYNMGDITSLELNYLKLRPFITGHPNIGLFILDGLQRCPSCGSDNLKDCGKNYYTSVGVYELRKCDDCGANSRIRKSKTTPKEKNGILSPSAR